MMTRTVTAADLHIGDLVLPPGGVVFHGKWFWRTFRDADGQAVLQYGPCRGWLARRALAVPGRGVAAILQADSVFRRGVASSRTDPLSLGQEYQLAQKVGVRTSVHRTPASHHRSAERP